MRNELPTLPFIIPSYLERSLTEDVFVVELVIDVRFLESVLDSFIPLSSVMYQYRVIIFFFFLRQTI